MAAHAHRAGRRSILADRPRVTRFPIDWENPQADPQRRQFEADNMLAGADEDAAGLAEDADDGDEEDEEDEDAGMEVEVGAQGDVTTSQASKSSG